MLPPNFQVSPEVKVLINIGALLDIPTGTYYLGKHGESVLNGGLGMFTGITGPGNSFKSTLLHYMQLSALDKVLKTHQTYLSTYDSEVNIHKNRLQDFTQKFPDFKDRDIMTEGIWNITDKLIYFGNQWWKEHREYLIELAKTIKDHMATTPFIDKKTGQLFKMPVPSFTSIDSFTEFDTEEVNNIQKDNELGDSGGNTIHMRMGLAKTRFLMDLPSICGRSNNYILMVAHLGQDMQIGASPYAPQPPKKLPHLSSGQKLKGVTDKFFFLLSNLWQMFDARPLLNKTTTGPEYPRHPNDPQPNDMDLNIVTVKLLRSKSGQSGVMIKLLVSQTEGVLASLSEFHYLKTEEHYGMSGNNVNYHLELLPDVNLTRTTIRTKIDLEPLLPRALNITAEMCQIFKSWRHLDPELICSPKQLYEDIKSLGYDWNVLLRTRGYWVLENDEYPIPFLSTMDLLKMRKGLYFPYWMEQDKSIKPKYAKMMNPTEE